MLGHYLFMRKIGHTRTESFKRAGVAFLADIIPVIIPMGGLRPTHIEYDIEENLMTLESMVDKNWDGQPYSGVRGTPIPGIQQAVELVHAQFNYDPTQFSEQQSARYFLLLENTPEPFKLRLEEIAQSARIDKRNHDDEVKKWYEDNK